MNLNSLKAKTLQHVAFLTGMPSAGTKSHIADCLQSSLQKALLSSEGCRVLSVDMGIRNLAYCVVDVPALSRLGENKLQVQSWKRLDLLDRLKPEVFTLPPKEDSPETSSPRGRSKPSTTANIILKDAFTPSVMSKAALGVANDFLKYKPDVILIERQRFRSGGGSAIQEWTVRVNTLESMLWACFETMRFSQLREYKQPFPAIHEVAPKRVAGFWTASPDVHRPPANLLTDGYSPSDGKTVVGKAKGASAVKKEKIAVLRSWLEGSGGVSLEFSPETQITAEAFAAGPKRRPSKKVGTDAAHEVAAVRETKLDDLADCVLQATAWVRWEENRRAILEAVAEQRSLR